MMDYNHCTKVISYNSIIHGNAHYIIIPVYKFNYKIKYSENIECGIHFTSVKFLWWLPLTVEYTIIGVDRGSAVVQFCASVSP